jgi:streptogramin lyase
MSIKTSESKYNLINNRIKYGTNNGIIVDIDTLIVDASNNRVGINTRTPQATLDVSSSQQENFFTNITNVGYVNGQNTQILSDVNDNTLWSYNQYILQGNNFLTENTVDLSGFSYFDSTSGKFAGGVLAPNGNIYCIPHNADYVAIINPVKKTVDTTSIRNVIGGTTGAKWYGGVVTSNGNIYCIPYNSSNILIINTLDNTTSYITGITVANYPTIVANTDKWIGGALAPNGKIYCAPYFAQSVLIIDTTNNTINLTDISGLVNIPSNPGYYYNRLIPRTSNVESFGGAVLHPNGKIYFIPTAARGLLQIDPNINTPDASSYIAPISIIPSGQRFGYFGGCLGPDYNIYIAAWNANRILKINVTTDISSQQFVNVPTDISLTTNGQRWQGIVCGQNGKIYGIPFGSTNSVIIDPVTTFANQTTIPVYAASRKYSGGVLAPDGVIYCIPRDAPTIMTIKTSLPTLEPWMLAPEFNKF